MTCFDDADVWLQNSYDLKQLAAQGCNQDFFGAGKVSLNRGIKHFIYNTRKKKIYIYIYMYIYIGLHTGIAR